MDRASDSGSEGWGFESLPAYQRIIIRTLSQWEKGSDYFCFWEDTKDSKKFCHQPPFTPKMWEWKCHLQEKRGRQAGGTLCGYLLVFPFLSFRCFRSTLSQPLPELPLAFFTFVVGEDVRENAPGDVFDFVLRNTGMLHELLLAAQAGCSLRFDMKLLRCSCSRVDNLLLTAWLPS